ILPNFRSLQQYGNRLSSSCTARAVLVDMEPKVVQAYVDLASQGSSATSYKTQHYTNSEVINFDQIKGWDYNPAATVIDQAGSGNNWAYGYNIHGKKHEDAILQCINKQLEMCEYTNALLLFQSMAGGTGAGVGSFILQCLKDYLPKTPLYSVCVWPFLDGEISIQSYNAALSLDSAYQFCEGIFFLENERFKNLCRHIDRSKDPTVEAINHQMSLFLTASTAISAGTMNIGGYMRDPLSTILNDLCCHPSYKLLTSRFLPQTAESVRSFSDDSYPSLLRRLHHMFSSSSIIDFAASGYSDYKEDSNVIPGSNDISSMYNQFVNMRIGTSQRPKFYCFSSQQTQQSLEHEKNKHTQARTFSYSESEQKESKFSQPIVTNSTTRLSGTVSSRYSSKSFQSKKTISLLGKNNIRPKKSPVVSPQVSLQNASVGSILSIYGEKSGMANADSFKEDIRYSSWCIDPLKIWKSTHSFSGLSQSVAMISNCQTPLFAISTVLRRAEQLALHNAYIHQFEQFNLQKEEILVAIRKLQYIQHSYQSLSHL
ncbi:tubulin/FtsZ family, GTPase domain-containing protein, partial [Cardiosporidium cionae]